MGKQWSQVQGGRAAAVVLAEPRGEEPSTFPAAGAYAKNDVCDKKRWNQGGERPLAEWAQQNLLMLQKTEYTSEGCLPPALPKTACQLGWLPSLYRLFLFPSVKPEMTTPTAFITSLRSVKT